MLSTQFFFYIWSSLLLTYYLSSKSCHWYIVLKIVHSMCHDWCPWSSLHMYRDLWAFLVWGTPFYSHLAFDLSDKFKCTNYLNNYLSDAKYSLLILWICLWTLNDFESKKKVRCVIWCKRGGSKTRVHLLPNYFPSILLFKPISQFLIESVLICSVLMDEFTSYLKS